jgi:hypothetical protein
MRASWVCRGLVLGAMFPFVGLPLWAQDKVELKVVKYAGLADTIKQLKGKVIVVDFWADY